GRSAVKETLCNGSRRTERHWSKRCTLVGEGDARRRGVPVTCTLPPGFVGGSEHSARNGDGGRRVAAQGHQRAVLQVETTNSGGRTKLHGRRKQVTCRPRARQGAEQQEVGEDRSARNDGRGRCHTGLAGGGKQENADFENARLGAVIWCGCEMARRGGSNRALVEGRRC